MREPHSDRALVAHREINSDAGGATIFCVVLADGFILDCGSDGYAQRRAELLATTINNADPSAFAFARATKGQPQMTEITDEMLVRAEIAGDERCVALGRPCPPTSVYEAALTAALADHIGDAAPADQTIRDTARRCAEIADGIERGFRAINPASINGDAVALVSWTIRETFGLDGAESGAHHDR